MWANVAVGTLGVLCTGAVVTAGIVYRNEIGESSFFSGMVNGLKDLSSIEALLGKDEEPKTPLTEDEKNYTPYSVSGEGITDPTFGAKYGKLLVGVEKDDWWTKNVESRKDLIDDTKSVLFKSIKSETTLSSAVKEKCEEAYKKKESDLKEIDIFDIWVLCSPIRSKPLSTNSSGEKYKDKLGQDSKYSSYFLEDRPKNKYAWEMLYEKFVKSESNGKSSEFSGVDKGYSSDEKDSNALNKVCLKSYSDEASKLDAQDKNNYKSNVLKFCTFISLDLQTANK